MASVKLKLWRYGEEPPKGYSIKIIALANRVQRVIATGLYCQNKYWNHKRNEPRMNHPYYLDFIKTITDLKQQCYRAEVEANVRGLDVHEIIDLITGREDVLSLSFHDWAMEHIEKIKATGRVKTAQGYKTALEQFEAFTERKTTVYDLNYTNLNGFKIAKQQNVKPNTIHNYLRALRTLYNEGVKQGIIKDQPYPFIRGLMPKLPPPKKRAIDKDVFQQLATIELKGNQDTARNFFCLQVALAGIDFVDLLNIKVRGDYVHFHRTKLAGSGGEVVLLITEPAKKYLHLIERIPSLDRRKDYDQFRELMNKNLQRIDIDAHLTTKAARHTFATEAKRLFVDSELLMELMGHETRDVPSIYKDKFSQKEKDKALMKVVKSLFPASERPDESNNPPNNSPSKE